MKNIKLLKLIYKYKPPKKPNINIPTINNLYFINKNNQNNKNNKNNQNNQINKNNKNNQNNQINENIDFNDLDYSNNFWINYEKNKSY